MLYLEIQEGRVRMARKRFARLWKATTACTLRLAEGAELSELGKRREDCVDRVLVGDSWFASFETAKALRELMKVHFVGNIKTAHRKFPQDQIRWDLSRLERGDHVIYKEKETGMFAVGGMTTTTRRSSPHAGSRRPELRLEKKGSGMTEAITGAT